jgi:hypothetical protein
MGRVAISAIAYSKYILSSRMASFFMLQLSSVACARARAVAHYELFEELLSQ